jgi:hypothetical protein
VEVPQQQTKNTNNIKHFKVLQMKNGITLLFAMTIIGGVLAYYNKQTETLSEDKFLERDSYLNKRIDSLKAMVLDLAKNQDTIKTDLDTLKSGQRIIFDEVKKTSEKTFWNLF